MGHDLSHITGPRPRTIRPPKPHDGWTKAQLWARILALEEKLAATNEIACAGAHEADRLLITCGVVAGETGQSIRRRLGEMRSSLYSARDTSMVPMLECGPTRIMCDAGCRCRPCRKERGE